jgi:hypothetical protein
MASPRNKGVWLLGRDADGFLVASGSDFSPWLATECCHAPVSVDSDDGTTYCKGCYAEADSRLGGAVADLAELERDDPATRPNS